MTDEFIAKYVGSRPPFNALGEFVYYRTYSRWLPDKGRRETWLETCRRSVDYNVGLQFGDRDVSGAEYITAQAEAQRLFDNMFNLRQFLSGRTLWVGGTDVSRRYPTSNFSCSFTVLDSIEALEDIFYLLMVGTGCGFRILRSDVEQFPAVRTDVTLHQEPYIGVPKPLRSDHTQLTFGANSSARIVVGDSKEGWVQALGTYFRLLTHKDYRDITDVSISYDHVRPKGERLKVFGGTASGHESLQRMFEKIHKVVQGRYAPIEGCILRPIHLLDIANIIGENVVVGGVRRTAEIALLDQDDTETINAKNDLTPDLYHRFMSNNSIFYTRKPTRDDFAAHFRTLRDTGEPAFVNAEAASRRRPNFCGVNPCVNPMEIGARKTESDRLGPLTLRRGQQGASVIAA